MEKIDELKEWYKREVKSVWDGCYDRHIWRTVHQCRSEEANIKLAKREMDLFLEPTKEKCHQLIKNIKDGMYHDKNPSATFGETFFIHDSVAKYLAPKYECKEVYKVCNALDYGCGSLARYTQALANRFYNVFAVDSSPKAIEHAKRKYKRSNVDYIETSGVDLESFRTDSIDFVFSNLVFQHVGSKEIMIELIKEVYRVLAVPGVFRASFWMEEKPDDHKDVYHGTGFDVVGYKKIFEDIGFKVEAMTHDLPRNPILWATCIKEK